MDKIIESIHFYHLLSNREKEDLNSNISSFKLNSGEYLNKKELCGRMILVKSGIIRVFLVSKDGREITLYKLKENDICVLALRCNIDESSKNTFAISETDSEIITISKEYIDRIKKDNSNIQEMILNGVQNRMNDMISLTSDIVFKSSNTRIYEYLLNSKSDIIYKTHEEIARETQNARETVSRCLKKIEKDNLISLSRSKIKILNREEIRKIIEN